MHPRHFKRGSRIRLFAACLTAFTVGCGDESSTRPDRVPPGDNLVLTRDDGSVIEITSPQFKYVWLGPWASDVPVPSLRIIVAGSSAGQPGWSLDVVLDDVEVGVPLMFPNPYVWDQPDHAHFFIFDAPTSNELSTQKEDSTGSLTFHSLPSRIGEEVAFSINAVVGSEFFSGTPVTVTGTFQAVVGEGPPN